MPPNSFLGSFLSLGSSVSQTPKRKRLVNICINQSKADFGTDVKSKLYSNRSANVESVSVKMDTLSMH
jgi:hypothetical protein